MYSAICAVIEAWAARLHADTLEAEFENADWAMVQGDED